MPPVGFETTISAGERPQTYALDRAATGTGGYFCLPVLKAGEHLVKPRHVARIHHIQCVAIREVGSEYFIYKRFPLDLQ